MERHAGGLGNFFGEAEFYGAVEGSGIGLGRAAVFNDVGIKLPLRVWTDSSAAIGICGRQGLGKLRHVFCPTLWVQQRVRRGGFELRKVNGEVNPAGFFTEHIESQAKFDSLLKIFVCELREHTDVRKRLVRFSKTRFRAPQTIRGRSLNLRHGERSSSLPQGPEAPRRTQSPWQ